MPSLRRAASSPSVRLSPYSYSSSFAGAQVARGHGHRRSSGSETSSRRILADIEWWRVTDGQCEPSADQESEERNRDDAQDNVVGTAGVVFLSTDVGVDHPSTPSLPWLSALPASSTESSPVLPTSEFAALSITPHTPLRRHLTLDDSVSASSSLESTPEPVAYPLEGLHLGLSDMDTGFFGKAFAPLSTFEHGRLDTLPPSLTRALTFADCLSLQEDAGFYADLDSSPLSSSPSFLN